MRVLLVLLLLTQFAMAGFLEIRQVVEAGEGAQRFDRPQGGEQLTVSREVIASEHELAGVWAIQTTPVLLVLKFNEEGEGKIDRIHGAKDEAPKVAVIIDGKLTGVATLKAKGARGGFVRIDATSLRDAEELADQLRAKMPAGTPEFFEIRRIVGAGQGKRTAKIESTGEEVTLGDVAIVTSKHLSEGIRLPSPKQGLSKALITLNVDGAKRMEAATKNHQAGQLRLAILIRGKLVAAPAPLAVPVGENLMMKLHGHATGEIDRQLNPNSYRER